MKGLCGEMARNWRGGLPNCIDCGKKLGRRGRKRCKTCSNKTRDFKRIGIIGLIKQQNSKEPTSIEKIVYELLKSRGIIFEKQKLINGRFLVDAYIPDLNLIIECDGNYWHSLDRVKNKDKAENAYLDKCGYKLLRLSEEEIISGTFKERLG